MNALKQAHVSIHLLSTHNIRSMRMLAKQSCLFACFFFFPDVLKFDNSHCWTHSKEVFYSVKVVPPEEERSPLPQEHTGQCLVGTSNEATSLLGVAPEKQEDSTSLYFTPSPGSSSLSPADSSEDLHRDPL